MPPPVNTAPTLSNFATSVTFAENTVNATPQLLDAYVTFTDPDDNFDGGTLSLTGLLAEDTVSVRDQGIATGEIGFDGTDVRYGGVVIGTLAGGAAGADLTITFSAAATSVAVDALIQNLTYANNSDAPTGSRDLLLNVTDAAGEDLGVAAGASTSFTALTGAANPFTGIDVGDYSVPSFFDLDGDGDLDLVVGELFGTLRSFANGGAGGFTELTGVANPFDGIDVGDRSAPSFVDLDGDGDLDLVVGANDGTLRSFANDGAGGFTALTGVANPFDGIDVGSHSTPSFVDLDGDGDLDLVVGEPYGTLSSFANDGVGEFTELTGVANPFDGIDVGYYSTPSAVDLDGDGDLDLVVGELFGTLRSFASDGVGGFTEMTGVANPFDGIDVGSYSTASFVDLDADGDLDLVVGSYDGTLRGYENTSPHGVGLTVTITPENDAPTGSGLPATVAGNEDETFDVDLSGVQLNDPDGAPVAFGLTIQVSEGRVDLAAGAGVIVLLSGTSTGVVYGTAAALEAYLQGAGAVRYTGAPNAFGDGVATMTLIGNDGEEQTTFGTINIDLSDVVDTQIGGSGNDRLTGDNGQDVLIGNDGNDVILGGAGADTMAGGDGVDWLQYTGSDASVTVDLNADPVTGMQSASGGDATGDQIQGFEYVRGSAFNDVLIGNDERNFLIGDDGADSISGGGGNDLIRGGAGADTMAGGEGIDWLQYTGSDAGVTVDLNADPVTGMQSASGGDAAGDQIQGFEYVRGSDFDDVLIGNDERNVLIGDDGADIISGGGGNDVIRGGAGADTMAGGDGVDWLQYIGSDAGVTVDLNADPFGMQSASGGDATGDQIQGFEYLRGSDFNDVLIGNAERNVLIGDNGDDVISGSGGNDVIRGGAGADTMAGGDGIDWLQYTGSDAGVTVDLGATTPGVQSASGGDAEGDGIMEFENILGSSFDDFLIGDAGRNVIYGGDGDDFLAGWRGNDVLNGGAGSDGFVFVIDSTNLGNPQIGGGDVATVLDFNVTDDIIVFISMGGPDVTLDVLPENIVSNATGQAETVDQFIIYNTTTGELSFDFDANGTEYDAAVFADIGLDHTLTVDNFAFL